MRERGDKEKQYLMYIDSSGEQKEKKKKSDFVKLYM